MHVLQPNRLGIIEKLLQLHLGALALMTATATKTSLEKNIWEMVTNCDYCFFLASCVVDRPHCKWTGRSPIKVNLENERFTVVYSRCHYISLRNFVLSFDRLRQRIVLKCVPHVQHDYFSSLLRVNNLCVYAFVFADDVSTRFLPH